MYRIKTIKEIEAAGYDLKKIPKEIFDNLGNNTNYFHTSYGEYATYDPLPQRFPGTIRVINEIEWEQRYKHVKPASDLKPWLGVALHHNAHLRCDRAGNFWFWETATKTPNYITSEFIINSIPTTLDITEFKRNLTGDTNLNTRIKLSEAATDDFFKLETETEYKINLNPSQSYIAKRDVAGYKKGDILSYQKVDALTGDPLVIDLNTGKEVRIRHDDYEYRNNTEYLRVRMDN